MLPLLVMAAQPANDAASGLVSALAACRATAEGSARLACYDVAVGQMLDAQRKKEIVVLERSEVQKAKRALFGFSLPSIRLFGGGENDEQLKKLVGTMQASTSLPGGRVRFSLDNGGTWESVDQTMLAPRRGDTVTITAGTLGSYVATAPGRRSMRVHRIR